MNPDTDSQPGSCAVAFKEWAGVCDALALGRQSIILRKGGIREEPGAGRFVPDHREFWLYPTAVHQAQQGLRLPPRSPAPDDDDPANVPIGLLARVEMMAHLDEESALAALEPHHVLTPETVRGRFHYRTPGLWVLVVRIWRREPPIWIAATAEHAGCKTWVALDESLPTLGLSPALDDPEWATRLEQLRTLLGHDRHQIPTTP
jgi:hypothetical protein